MNMIEKTRIGSKVTKKYDRPQTPYQRILAHSSIPEANKERLRHHYQQLNPAALKREITKLQDKLFATASSKRKLKQYKAHEPSFSYISL